MLVRRGGARLEFVDLRPQRRVDLAIIAAASLYAPVIVLRGHLAWQDAVVLLGLYVLYLRRIATGSPEPPHLVGVAAELGGLPQAAAPALGRRDHGLLRRRGAHHGGAVRQLGAAARERWSASARTCSSSGWCPLATESPELVIAFVLIQHDRAAQGVAVLLSSAVSQWTLALGTLPLAYAAGGGKGALPLLGREQVEVLLTMGQGCSRWPCW